MLSSVLCDAKAAKTSRRKAFFAVQPWTSLEELCRQFGGALAMIDDDAARNDALSVCSDSERYWIEFRYRRLSAIADSAYREQVGAIFTTQSVPEEHCRLLGAHDLLIPHEF